MDEYIQLEQPYIDGGKTAKEQMYIHFGNRYREIINTIERYIRNNKMEQKDALDFRQKILNYCANLLSKNFENKEDIGKYFNKLFGELNIKFLFEDATKQKKEMSETALIITFTGMIFALRYDEISVRRLKA